MLSTLGGGDILIDRHWKRKIGGIGSEDLVEAFFPLEGFLATQNLTWQSRVFKLSLKENVFPVVLTNFSM